MFCFLISLFFLSVLPLYSIDATPVVNGTEVPQYDFPEVVKITGPTKCTGVLVGPKVVLSSAHCRSEGTQMVEISGYPYMIEKFFRSPIYPARDHDMGIIVLSDYVHSGYPVSIGTPPMPGEMVEFLGFGCLDASGHKDGILRMGVASLTSFYNYDFITHGNQAACYGDSGGPAYIKVNGLRRVIGMVTKSNLRDATYFVRLDLNDSIEFLKDVARSESVSICGINLDC